MNFSDLTKKFTSAKQGTSEPLFSDEKTMKLFDNLLEGVQIVGRDLEYLYVNEAFGKQCQRKKDELVGHRLVDVFPDIEKTEFYSQLKECLDHHAGKQIESELKFPDGAVGWFEFLITPIAQGVFVASVNRTLKKHQQEELLQVTSIVESSSDAIIATDLTGAITEWNPQAETVYGYFVKEMVGKSMKDIIPDDRVDEFEDLMRRARNGEQVSHFETERRRKDGKIIEVLLTISPIRNAANEIIGVSDTGQDISERKKQDAEIARLAAIVESSEDAIIGKDLQGAITTWNKGAEKLYRYAKSEMVGKSDIDLIPQDRKAEWEMLSSKLTSGLTIKNFETVRLRKDGRTIDVSITFSPISDRKGDIIGSSAIVRDITERKRVDRMKSEFVAMASHQMKTPLTAIKWYSELLLKRAAPQLSEKQVKQLLEIHRANRRMIYLINALLNVSRIELGTFVVNPYKQSIVEIIETVLQDFALQIEERNMRFEKQYDPDLPDIFLDENVMRIILANLVLNAIRYSPVNGKIEIRITRTGDTFTIQITDQGIGIPESQKGKIFTKFYRAENAMAHNADGSGLGLYIVKSLVDQSGGIIGFTSEENKGTTFSITYPIEGMKKKDTSVLSE